MKKFVLDIEANGFTPTEVFCICIKDLQDNSMYSIHQNGANIGRFQMWLEDQGECELIGHNIIGYDIPVLQRLLGADFSNCKITDTLVLSRLADPSRGRTLLRKLGTYLEST